MVTAGMVYSLLAFVGAPVRVGRIDGCKACANTQMHLHSSNPVISLFICYQFLPEISAPTNFICSAALKLSTPMMIRRALLMGELRSALAQARDIFREATTNALSTGASSCNNVQSIYRLAGQSKLGAARGENG